MENTVFGVICLISGILIIIFSEPFSRRIVNQQNKLWQFNFGKKDIEGSNTVAVIVSFALIIFGLALLFRMVVFT